MTDLSISKELAEKKQDSEKPQYERPALMVMNQEEVLQAFQISATEISAAGCWWNPC